MFGWNKPKAPTPANGVYFSWTPECDIGIQRFDQEHRQLAGLINQLHTLMVVKRDRAAADQLADQLLKMTRTHFASEEDLLAETEYEELESHRQQHSDLINELRDLHRQFKAGTLSALAMPNFLKKWLMEHIQNSDRRYVPHLKSKGVD
jgi:hemerythrin